MHDDPENLDAVFHALADATRRTILIELGRRNDQPLFEICVRLVDKHHLNLSRQAISKHLTVLEQAGLVSVRKKGRTKLHTSNLPSVSPQLVQWLNKLDPSEEIE